MVQMPIIGQLRQTVGLVILLLLVYETRATLIAKKRPQDVPMQLLRMFWTSRCILLLMSFPVEARTRG